MADGLQLDLGNACLRQGTSAIPLSPKALAVVEYLTTHSGQISTKAALLDTVWANEDVSEYALTSIIRDLRRALGDSSKRPRYIETVHRRGYRWIGPVTAVPVTPVPVTSDQLPSQRLSSEPALALAVSPAAVLADSPISHPTVEPSGSAAQGHFFAGRTHELGQLHHYLKLAAQGQRQLVFLSGEAGIGKTSLLEEFTTQILPRANCSVALGQCIEKYGAGEAYRPVLEALNRFCLTAAGQPYISVLEQCAPSWLMQMPPLLTPEQLHRLQQQGLAPKSRWLRELAEALDIITQDRLLVLILEDLHWVDPATVELLDMLARRQESAQLLVLASYRPAEVSGHPLPRTQQELQLHNLCHEITLDALDGPAIEDYLVKRFPHQFLSPRHSFSAPSPTSAVSQSPWSPSPWSPSSWTVTRAATEIHQRTEGNPLFMVNVVESLIEASQGPGAKPDSVNLQNLSVAAVPSNLQQLIQRQFEALNNTQQQILSAASVEGAEFRSVTVAANLAMDSEQVEQHIDELVQLNHLITIDDVELLPNGSLSTRYRFIHALYQEGLYQKLSRNRRVRLHRALGAQLELLYGDQSSTIAAQLALHFEQGMDYVKAIGHRQQAGENALRRNAHTAAVEHVHQGLELLPKVKRQATQQSLELKLQTLLGTTLMTLKGQAAPAVGAAYTRAQLLYQQQQPNQVLPYSLPEQFEIILGLWRHTFICGNLPKALDLAQQCLTQAEQTQSPVHLGNAHYALAGTLMYQGQLTTALAHADNGLGHYRGHSLTTDAALHHSQDPTATLMAYRAWILFFMGQFDQARQSIVDMLALDIVKVHPQTAVCSFTYAGIFHMYAREFQFAQHHLEEAIQLAEAGCIPQFATIARFFLTCTLCLSAQAADKLPEIMQQTLTRRRAAGAELHATGYLNRIAEGYLAVNQPAASLATLAQVPIVAQQNHEQIFASDTCRLMGNLLALPGETQHSVKAESCLQQAMTLAQQQGAKTFELRAARDLAQLWQRQGKATAAKALLTPIYSGFTEGFHSFDLTTTKQLLETL